MLPVMAREDMDQLTRLRLRAWLRHYWIERTGGGHGTQSKFAASIRVAQSTVNLALNQERGPGLDVALKIHRIIGVSMDMLVDKYPWEIYPDKYKERSGELDENPESASQDQASAGGSVRERPSSISKGGK